LGVAAAVATPASAAGVDRYVSTAGTNSGTCQDSGNPCLTIGYAVTQAASGDVINVAAGTYAEVVTTTKSLTFEGANAGVSASGVRGPESIVKRIITSGSTPLDITIDGFRVDPLGDTSLISGNITLVSSLGGTAGTTIVNNVISGSDTYYPQCNAVAGCSVAGQQMAFGGVLVQSGPVTVRDNRIERVRYGLKLTQNNSSRPLVATVSNNVITQITIQGIGSGGATGQQQPGGTFSNNEIDAVGRTASPGGIVLTHGGNTIVDNTFTDLGSGVYLSLCKKWDTRNNTVDDNTFDKAAMVIETSFDGGQCITGTLGDIEGVGTWVTGGGRFDGFNANGNTFVNNAGAFRASSDVRWGTSTKPVTAGPIDITCNYWNSPSGPSNVANPTGTGATLTWTAAGAPDFTFLPWETAPDGPCNGPLASDPVVRVGDAETLEPASGQTAAYVPLVLDAPLAEAVEVSFYTVDGTAIGGNAPGVGVDYRRWGTPSSPRRVTIPAGSVQATINVPVYADGVGESTEQFSVKLASVSGGGVVLAADDEASVSIVDADSLASPVPVLNVSRAWAYTGTDGVRKAQFYVQLDRPAAEDVLVSVATEDGTALAGEAYTERSFTLRIPAGSTSRTVDVRVLNQEGAPSSAEFSLLGQLVSGPAVFELQMTGVGTVLGID
jgi:hypothetical protein